jgi:hypothetical protein
MGINKVAAGGKWVKVIGWAGLDVAHAELLDGVRRYSAQDR